LMMRLYFRYMPHALSERDLFSSSPVLPEGCQYAPDILTVVEEKDLVGNLQQLPFKEFEFQGFLGKRRVVSFGWRYDFNGGAFQRIDPIPDFLHPLRDRAAAFAKIEAPHIEHALITEYREGAAIGWHKDRSVFDDVIGVSLLSRCNFRFRRKDGTKWERRCFTAEPRSVYILRGPARTEWEHSIPGVNALRYSVTFRTLASRQR
jgi:alkylated DNA repair dioxygenase AlkB